MGIQHRSAGTGRAAHRWRWVASIGSVADASAGLCAADPAPGESGVVAYHISPMMQGPGQQLDAARKGPALPGLWTLVAEDWELPRTFGWRQWSRAMLLPGREEPIVAQNVRAVVVGSPEPGHQSKGEPR